VREEYIEDEGSEVYSEVIVRIKLEASGGRRWMSEGVEGS